MKYLYASCKISFKLGLRLYELGRPTLHQSVKQCNLFLVHSSGMVFLVPGRYRSCVDHSCASKNTAKMNNYIFLDADRRVLEQY